MFKNLSKTTHVISRPVVDFYDVKECRKNVERTSKEPRKNVERTSKERRKTSKERRKNVERTSKDRKILNAVSQYNLESYKSHQKISVGVASGQNLICDVYTLPLVFANNQAKPPKYFQFVAIDNCPATCLLGQAGLRKITLSDGKSAAEKFGEICQEIDAETRDRKNE